jgi:indole-3-glycerol phosphate synthase
MSNILDQILATKRIEIEQAKALKSIEEIKSLIGKVAPPRDFVGAIRAKHQSNIVAVIAEIKKASPSKGVIRENFEPILIAKSYESGGAACLSVLTDHQYFQGDSKYLMQVKLESNLPVLRKDFMIDPYQIFESRHLGADCILLIVAALNETSLIELENIALDLGMAVLVEVHNKEELDLALNLKTPLIGINNRNLKTFDVSLETTLELSKEISNDRIVVTESGIFTQADIHLMNKNSINTFLIGEALMRNPDPGESLAKLIYRN